MYFALNFCVSIFLCLSEKTAAHEFEDAPTVPDFSLPPGQQFAVGGTFVFKNEFPHMVALGFRNANWTKPRYLCGGTLISDQYVMTAAHCTIFKNTGPASFVRLGAISVTFDVGDFENIPISETTRHPDYRAPSTYNDIALLKMEKKVRFRDNILPARLQVNTDLDKRITELNATGWGKTNFIGPQVDNLVKVTLKLATYSECRDRYKNASKEKLPDGIVNGIQICAGGELGVDTCQGDSGGPLGYKVGPFHYVVGIVSFGKACGLTPSPGVYTRVSAYFLWIEPIVFPPGKFA